MLAQLEQHAWFGNRPLSIYGDPAYPLSIHLEASFRGAYLTEVQKSCNKATSSVRVSVEWLFGLKKNYFKFMDFKQMQRIGMSPAGKVYVVCALLQNANTCLRDNIISETFNMEPPNIRHYFQ